MALSEHYRNQLLNRRSVVIVCLLRMFPHILHKFWEWDKSSRKKGRKNIHVIAVFCSCVIIWYVRACGIWTRSECMTEIRICHRCVHKNVEGKFNVLFASNFYIYFQLFRHVINNLITCPDILHHIKDINNFNAVCLLIFEVTSMELVVEVSYQM